MTRINLLPWRAERRKQRQKDSMMMLALSAVAAVMLSFLIITYYNGQISGQGDRNAYLTTQIGLLDKQIEEIEELDRKKSKLLARKEVIEVLQANRSQMVHLFDSLVRTIPDGVVLTSVKQDNDTLTLDGRSQSNARVSTYLRMLEQSGWMTAPELAIIEAKGEDKGLPYVFTLQVKLANPNAPKDADGDGIPDAPVAQEGEFPEVQTTPLPEAPVPDDAVEQRATPSAAPDEAGGTTGAPEAREATEATEATEAAVTGGVS
ncbi:MAG: PilN domain-containing protein [Lysobacter sp.]|nr:PilN domain-containing protein [Lysobacter sp.]